MYDEIKNLDHLIHKTKSEIKRYEMLILNPDDQFTFFDMFSEEDQKRYNQLTNFFQKFDQKFSSTLGDASAAPRSYLISKYFENSDKDLQRKKKIYNDLVNYKKNYNTNLLTNLSDVKDSIDRYNETYLNEPKNIRRLRTKGCHLSRKPIATFVELVDDYLEKYRRKTKREERKCQKLRAEIDEIKNDMNQYRLPKGKMRRTKPKVLYEENRPVMLFGVQFLRTVPKLGDCFVFLNDFCSKYTLLTTGQMTALINRIDEIIKEKKLFRKRRIKRILAPRERYIHCTDDVTKRAHKMVARFVSKKPMNQKIKKYNRKNRPANIKKLIEHIVTVNSIPKDRELENGHFH